MAQKVEIPKDTMVSTSHSVKINGKSIDYTAETGMMPLWNESGTPIASLFYTYYKRKNINNTEDRPLVISFNGGPVLLPFGCILPILVKGFEDR